MPKTDFELKELLDLPLWEKLQDQLAALTGLAMVCIDLRGRPVTKHSGTTALCNAVRADAAEEKLCRRCDAMAALEAVRMGEAYIYLCHRGIVDAAVPITVGNRYMGAVIFGQVRLPAEDMEKVRRLVSDVSKSPAESEADMDALYNEMPLISYSRLEEIAGFMRCLVDYTVERYLKALERTELLPGHSTYATDEARSGSVEDSKREQYSAVSRLSPVYPAVVYVHEHLTESISMNAMAQLCHLSASYFSRIFSREVGESFVSYVNRNKVELAKMKLCESNRSVSQIASEVGFHDTSHFISLFKRFEGVTPTSFRQLNCR